MACASQLSIIAVVMMVAAALPDMCWADSGSATYYDPPYTGNACGITPPSDNMLAAGSSAIYNGGAGCGSYYTISYNGNSVTVEIIDYCPGCASNQFDLSTTAFSSLADLSLGRIDITYSQA